MEDKLLIVDNLNGHYNDSLERYYDFKKLSETSTDHVFFYGLGSLVEIYGNEEFANKFKPNG